MDLQYQDGPHQGERAYVPAFALLGAEVTVDVLPQRFSGPRASEQTFGAITVIVLDGTTS